MGEKVVPPKRDFVPMSRDSRINMTKKSFNNYHEFLEKGGEEFWQKNWEKEGIFEAKNDSKKPKYYCLVEFPYPSGEGLHVGHPRSYTAMDVIARKRRMEGKNVLYPIGWDAFGLPAENYAIKTRIHPAISTKNNIANFKRQLKSLGFSFDWSREFATTDPEYYKWTQWMFLQFFKHGLAYKDKIAINWCKNCKIGLANEEVVDGKCERCGGEVEKREKEQWMIRITKYAQRLLDDLDKVDYLPQIKEQQKNWIGKSAGAKIKFEIITEDRDEEKNINLLKNSQHSSQTIADLTQNDAEIDSNRFLYKDLTYKIRGAIFTVKKQLGLGHKEDVYHKALEMEFKKIGLSFESKKNIDVKYDDKKVGVYQPDFIVEDKVLIELKALPEIGKPQLNQTWTYLKGNDYKLALLVNFGSKELQIKRIVYDMARSVLRESASVQRSSATSVEVFTTRPDTLFGATYMVLSPEHELVRNNELGIKNYEEVKKYIEQASKKSDLERTELQKEKSGVELKGIKAINPVNNEEIPVWVADYVLASYGTGAIMAVPAHDERDFEFAKKFGLEIREVVKNKDTEISSSPLTRGGRGVENIPKNQTLSNSPLSGGEPKIVFSGEGVNINSDFLDGSETAEAKEKMINWLEEKNLGQRAINYKLRDWVFSRQRYWGEPIPLIHCQKCGWVQVLEKDLPVKLPEVEKYEPTDTGESPLASIKDWVNTKCPKCGGVAKRETDTMPNWAGSSWYFLRYVDAKNKKEFASEKNLKYWMPIDWYNGGMEHTTLHLLYSRFWYKFLYDIGEIPKACGDEPYQKRTSHGMILGEGGEKMSKSRGNVINPDDVVAKHGADTFRTYEMFMGPFDQAIPWNTKGVVGVRRFLEKVWRFQEKVSSKKVTDKNLEKLLHKTIKKVSEDIEEMKFNTAISQMMILVNEMDKQEELLITNYQLLIKILSPFAPFIAEELWYKLGNKKSIHLEKWPEYDEKLVKDKEVNLVIQINGKRRGQIVVPADITEKQAGEKIFAMEEFRKWIGKTEPKKVVFVPGKLINIVI